MLSVISYTKKFVQETGFSSILLKPELMLGNLFLNPQSRPRTLSGGSFKCIQNQISSYVFKAAT